ncbi:MAG: transcriptional regulator [Spirochaetia bacterium]|jgi:HTH-type transcriptional regulator/antitoxin HigA|nr:transcriptional regulator [Spirochaetia bacterium]
MNFVVNNETEKVSRFLLNIQINTDEELDRAIVYAEELTDSFEDGNTVIEPLLDYVLNVIEKYENKHYPIEESSPITVLRFLMDQNGHRQKDLIDIAPKSAISEILSGKRHLNKNHIEKLSKKYHTNPSVFF